MDELIVRMSIMAEDMETLAMQMLGEDASLEFNAQELMGAANMMRSWAYVMAKGN